MMKIPYTLGDDIAVRDFMFSCASCPSPRFLAELIAEQHFDGKHSASIPEKITLFLSGSRHCFAIRTFHVLRGDLVFEAIENLQRGEEVTPAHKP